MNVEKIIDDLVAAIIRRDAKTVGSMFAKDSVFADGVGTGGVTYGQEKIQELWDSFCQNVSHNKEDNKWVIHKKIISGNNAVIERTSHFIYKGKKVAIDIVAIIEIDNNGKIKSFLDYFDSRVLIPQEDADGWKAYCDSFKKLGVTPELKR